MPDQAPRRVRIPRPYIPNRGVIERRQSCTPRTSQDAVRFGDVCRRRAKDGNYGRRGVVVATASLDVLRRIIDNLGGDSDIP